MGVGSQAVGCRREALSVRRTLYLLEGCPPDLQVLAARPGAFRAVLRGGILPPFHVRAQQPLPQRFFHGRAVKGEVLGGRVPA
eukprot:15923363-Heterocapsa_arctica.AAC.1